MNEFLAIAALTLMLLLVAGLFRVLRGPTPADRLMAAQLMGTTAIAALLLLVPVIQVPALLDVALIFALLAAVAAAALTRRRQRSEGGQ